MGNIAGRLAALVLLAGLFGVACQSSTTVDVPDAVTESSSPATPAAPAPSPSPTSTVEVGETAEPVESANLLTDDLALAIDIIGDAFGSVAAAWEGFAPNEDAVVLVLKDSEDQLTGALAINHPVAVNLGTATPIDTAGTPFTSLDLITDLDERSTLAAVQTFEFSIVVGGIDSFAMVAGGSDEFFDPSTKTYASTLVHEMFHRYQAETFEDRGLVQDIDGYDYSADSLALIGLEQRALKAAIAAETEPARLSAARHVVAIRTTRLLADSRAALDSRQEVREGTARYVEHVLGGTNATFDYNLANVGESLIADIPAENIKGEMAFGRWYASGAALLHLLDQLGVPDVSSQIELGESPIGLLVGRMQVDASEMEQLVDEANAAYDPTNELAEQAEIAAEAVLSEPNFWGDDNAEALEQILLTPEQVTCLRNRGVLFDGGGLEISQADWDTCLGQ